MAHYSTLEVRTGTVENYDGYSKPDGFKEAFPQPTSHGPQQVPYGSDQSRVSDLQVLHGNEGPPAETTSEIAQKPPSRLWGLSRPRLYILVAVALLVVGGVIAGGPAASSQGGSSDPPGAQDNPDATGSGPSPAGGNVHVLSTTRLASTNRTDADGYMHRRVFFQDPGGAIIARSWDERNRTWSTTNVTDVLRLAGTPANPALGTPLAGTSGFWPKGNGVGGHVHLYWLDPDSYVGSAVLETPDAALTAWQPEDFGAGRLQALAGSQLAATWQRCSFYTCGGHWLLAFQNPAGEVAVANSSDWGQPARVVTGDRVAPNSSLALAPNLHDGFAVNQVVLVSEAPLAAGVAVSHMQKSTYSAGWTADDGLWIHNIPGPTAQLQFAMTLLDNFKQTMKLALLPNGTVSAVWWGGYPLTIPSVTFLGGPAAANFTALAVSEDAIMYAVAGDRVLEYAPYAADLTKWEFSGVVYP
ncbi:hypothetical protein GGR52DRAFT_573740 [Hypoxylon sp. FL1284]|nr:hypothetical protein GGR52DRAFT_573740 [Hypoxylon sp. FL1284]